MTNLLRIAQGIDTTPTLLALYQQPELWNVHQERKTTEGTPHGAMSDIWLRYNDATSYREKGDFTGFNDPHDAVYYPAWYKLPQVRPIVYGLMARVEAARLGGVLITRVPAGKIVDPHIDTGWHAEYYNTKAYVVLQTNPKCVNRAEDETAVMAQGDVWLFDNTKMHSTENYGDEDRMTLIVCMRCER